jgi:hypothetical protein
MAIFLVSGLIALALPAALRRLARSRRAMLAVVQIVIARVMVR